MGRPVTRQITLEFVLRTLTRLNMVTRLDQKLLAEALLPYRQHKCPVSRPVPSRRLGRPEEAWLSGPSAPQLCTLRRRSLARSQRCNLLFLSLPPARLSVTFEKEGSAKEA